MGETGGESPNLRWQFYPLINTENIQQPIEDQVQPTNIYTIWVEKQENQSSGDCEKQRGRPGGRPPAHSRSPISASKLLFTLILGSIISSTPNMRSVVINDCKVDLIVKLT